MLAQQEEEGSFEVLQNHPLGEGELVFQNEVVEFSLLMSSV